MPKLTIDNREVEVESGRTILDAARKLEIDIPTLCFNEECDPSTSCLVCVVKANGRLVPSCATVAQDGMEVESETTEVHAARRSALELLLSDHLGDCIAPCNSACPAGMNIPLMIRQIAAGEFRDAIITVKKDIALPAVLGRICPAPCENVCRRRIYDSAVSICLLKRYAADVDLASETLYLPSCKPDNGKRVAIVGAGPTGLAAAYYLLQEGYGCVIFDDHEKPGGMLQYGVPEDRLPRDALDAEIGIIERLGAEFRMKTKIGEDLSMSDLLRDYDAVLVATGTDALMEDGIKINRNTLQSDLKDIFVGGNATGRKSKMAVRSVADGKTAAISIHQYLSGLPVTGSHRPFTVRIGKLVEGEIEKFMVGASEIQRLEIDAEIPPNPPLLKGGTELSNAQVETAETTSASSILHLASSIQNEAMRCLHCDCRKADNCKLRDQSEAYGAKTNRYKGERRLFEQYTQHPDIIYEPGKCISCGLCIQITSRAKEDLGLTFIGRGFNVRVGVPFSRTVKEGLSKVAAQCVEACPTGALAFK